MAYCYSMNRIYERTLLEDHKLMAMWFTVRTMEMKNPCPFFFLVSPSVSRIERYLNEPSGIEVFRKLGTQRSK